MPRRGVDGGREKRATEESNLARPVEDVGVVRGVRAKACAGNGHVLRRDAAVRIDVQPVAKVAFKGAAYDAREERLLSDEEPVEDARARPNIEEGIVRPALDLDAADLALIELKALEHRLRRVVAEDAVARADGALDRQVADVERHVVEEQVADRRDARPQPVIVDDRVAAPCASERFRPCAVGNVDRSVRRRAVVRDAVRALGEVHLIGGSDRRVNRRAHVEEQRARLHVGNLRNGHEIEDRHRLLQFAREHSRRRADAAFEVRHAVGGNRARRCAEWDAQRRVQRRKDERIIRLVHCD